MIIDWPFVRYVIKTYGVFIGTGFLGLVTAIAVIVSTHNTNKNLRKDRKLKLLELKLSEAYTPIIDKMTRKDNSRILLQDVIDIVHSKDYLIYPDIIKKCPNESTCSLDMPPERKETLRKQWQEFYESVCDDRKGLLNEYLELIGIPKKEIEPLECQPAKIDLGDKPP